MTIETPPLTMLDLAMSRGARIEVPAKGERLWQVMLHIGQGQHALAAILP